MNAIFVPAVLISLFRQLRSEKVCQLVKLT